MAPNWKRTLTIMFFAQMISMIGFSSIFPFLPLYVKSLGTVTGLSVDACIGLVFSGQALSMMIASPIWGALSDRWGRKLMSERALFGGAVIMEMMAFVTSAEQLVALRTFQGLITGTVGAANALVAAAVPRSQAGYAMGLMQVGMGVGLGLGPMIGGAVADAFGYQAAFHITAGLLAVAGAVVLFGVDEQFVKSSSASKNRPGFIGEWLRVLAGSGVWLIYSLRFMNQMGRMMFIPILPMFILLLIDNPGRGNSFTGLVIGLSSAATAVSAVFLGRAGDRFGHRRILIIGFSGCFVSFLLQGWVASGWQLLLLQVLLGIGLGGIIPGISALLACATRHGDEGAVYGLDNSITAGGRAVGPAIGVSISVFLGLRAVFSAAALLYLAAAVLAWVGLKPISKDLTCTTKDIKDERSYRL
jgi:DHA1 family multidrug resistance protein-like MFS transporter